MNKKVDKYINKQRSPQKEILQKLRTIIIKNFPQIHEEIKMGVPWYEGKFYLVGLKESVNIGFSVQGLVKKDMELFKGKGKFMRHLKFSFENEIDEKKIVKLLKIVHKKTK